MIVELSHFTLIVALGLSILLSTLPFYGAQRGNRMLMQMGRSLAVGQWVFVALAFAGLVFAFYNDDFSVLAVANGSNSALPWYYKVSAVWGAHEGSILLWILVHATWTIAVATFSRSLPLDVLARVLAVMGMISVGFLLFSLLTSNPFERTLPNVPADGNDLNPLLQDIGLIVHPPILYFGYVGFSVAFAFAIAALAAGKLDAAWARWSRPWTNAAWAFLTVGIALGSWWAYYELGWGGWWFWDPVENASFMPWLVGTALIHSLAVTEKRGVFKSWTVLLAIFAFSLSLLGTFLVRSGVLTSVHSFASDPTRGLYILIFLGVVIGGSLTLYALRVPSVQSRVSFGGLSREFFLLSNNVIFLLAMVMVLLGTLFPLLMDALGRGKYSVGPPYFNAMFVPMMAVLFALLGFGPSARWKGMTASQLIRPLVAAAIAALIVGLVFPFVYAGAFKWQVALAVALAAWVVLTSLVALRDIVLSKQGRWQWRRLRPAHAGMLIAHTGAAVTLLGVCLTSQYTIEKDVPMAPGDTQALGEYSVRFDEYGEREGPNYTAQQGVFSVKKNDKLVSVLTPEKREYRVQRNVMTEAGIDGRLTRDIFIALGEPLDGNNREMETAGPIDPTTTWSVRLQLKPFVRWMWLGALLMALGGVVAITDARYRRAPATSRNKAAEPVDAAPGNAVEQAS